MERDICSQVTLSLDSEEASGVHMQEDGRMATTQIGGKDPVGRGDGSRVGWAWAWAGGAWGSPGWLH